MSKATPVTVPTCPVPADQLQKFFENMVKVFDEGKFQEELNAAGYLAKDPKAKKPEEPIVTMKRVEAVRVARYKAEFIKAGSTGEKGVEFLKNPRQVYALPECTQGSDLQKAMAAYVAAEERGIRTAIMGKEAYEELKAKEKEVQETMKKADEDLAAAMDGMDINAKKSHLEGIQKKYETITKKLQEFKGDQAKMTKYVEGMEWDEQKILLQVRILQQRGAAIARAQMAQQQAQGGAQWGGAGGAADDDEGPPPLE